ncbi:MAG: sugar phosphate isomerase/epimerase [Spirochaetales bacterium]
MKPTISVQLYSVRDHAAADYEKTIRAIAAMGFTCVETAGFPGSSVDKAKVLFGELGLTATSCHGVLPIGPDRNKIIEDAQKVGTKYIVTGVSPKFKEDFVSVDTIKAAAALYSEAAEFAARFGMQVGYHNHDWEMNELAGKPAYRWFLENTPDTVLWEADVFWVKFGGRDPVEFVTEIGKRGKLIHLKDGRIGKKGVFTEAITSSGKIMVSSDKPFLPAGTGDIDLVAVAKAAKFMELGVVEIDSYEGDIMKAIAQSYTYLKGIL